MNNQKRSMGINLSRMRKGFVMKPLALGVTAIMLTACGGGEEAKIYKTADECGNDNPDNVQACQAAYQQAQQEAERTAPKYNSRQDCEYDFGAEHCRNVQSSSGSFFMPFMAGYMLSNLMSPRGYNSQPMFSSSSPYSSYRNRWMGADGNVFGDVRQRTVRVDKDVYKPKPTVNKTMSRGGFGSSVRAKSSWGSKSSSRGWGG
jgi:uncharacterized protein YgiB involved in biofilm formation